MASAAPVNRLQAHGRGRERGSPPMLGAAELCFDRVLTDKGVQAWTAGLTSRAAR